MAAKKRRIRQSRRFSFALDQEELRLLRIKAAEDDVSASELLRRMIRICLRLPEPDESSEQENPPRGR